MCCLVSCEENPHSNQLEYRVKKPNLNHQFEYRLFIPYKFIKMYAWDFLNSFGSKLDRVLLNMIKLAISVKLILQYCHF